MDSDPINRACSTPMQYTNHDCTRGVDPDQCDGLISATIRGADDSSERDCRQCRVPSLHLLARSSDMDQLHHKTVNVDARLWHAALERLIRVNLSLSRSPSCELRRNFANHAAVVRCEGPGAVLCWILPRQETAGKV